MTSWRRWRTSLLLLFAVLGPGFITANVDNDSGGIFTYSQAGAQYGYSLLWTMIPITLALIVVQEMCARMGVVTGKGLSDLIREECGLRMTFVMMILLVIVNFGNVIAEFSGIAGSMQLFHVMTWKSCMLPAIPENSAMTLPKLTMTRRIIMTKVMRRPHSSRMRSLRPLPVTTPMRAHISCTTMRARVMGIIVQRRE